MNEDLHLLLVSGEKKQVADDIVNKIIFNHRACCLTCTECVLHFAFDFSELVANILN